MNEWQQVIQTALIGTDKQTISTNEMDENLLPAFTTITSNTGIDKEEQFLQIATLIHQYTFCGTEPIVKADSSLPICEAETQAYCSSSATNILKEILYEDSSGLLAMWLQLCASKQQIVAPVLLPDLFEKAVQQKNLRQYITCFGKRGEWLSQFNTAWQFATPTSDEELWQRGTANERKTVLQQLRTTNPTQAREWLQETSGGSSLRSEDQVSECLPVLGSTILKPKFTSVLKALTDRHHFNHAKKWQVKCLPSFGDKDLRISRNPESFIVCLWDSARSNQIDALLERNGAIAGSVVLGCIENEY